MNNKRKTPLAVTHVGCAETTAFARRNHPDFEFPSEEVFAVALNHDTPDVAYGLVSEQDEGLEAQRVQESGELSLNSPHLEAFERAIRHEAIECGVKAPFSITIVTASGILSKPVRRLRRPATRNAA